MEQFSESLDMLDLVLAVFGAVIVALWFGRGKSLKGLLMGALMGGFVKPVIFAVLSLGAVSYFTAQSDTGNMPEQSQQEHDATIKFWTQ
jgi:carbon starvation protein CstA